MSDCVKCKNEKESDSAGSNEQLKVSFIQFLKSFFKSHTKQWPLVWKGCKKKACFVSTNNNDLKKKRVSQQQQLYLWTDMLCEMVISHNLAYQHELFWEGWWSGLDLQPPVLGTCSLLCAAEILIKIWAETGSCNRTGFWSTEANLQQKSWADAALQFFS